MDRLQETVRKIYEEAEEVGNIAAFGVANTDLPVEWTEFFRKRARGLRKEKAEVEPEEKEAETEPEILAEILSQIIKRIEEIESRLDIIEGIQEKIEKEPEAIRKGLDPETFLLKMQLEGAHGELRDRRGRQWRKN